jgi:integrase
MNRRGASRAAMMAQSRRATRSAGARTSSFLLEKTVLPATADRYRKAFTAFIQWGMANDDDAEDEEEMDQLLVEYFHELFDSGRGHSVAATTLHALVWLHPELKYQLPRAAQAVRGWNKMCPGHSYPPLTWELAIAIGVQLTRAGRHRHGIGVVLAFDCLLRVGELVALRREDVVDTGDSRLGFEHRGMILRLRRTKTGNNKSVRVLTPSVIELVRGIVRDTAPRALLFPFSTAVFRRALKGTCAELGLSSRYVPHSLRHGGATRYFHVLGWPVEDVMERGRWASTKSARLYIQSGVALLMSMRVPDRIAATAVRLAQDPVLFFALSHAAGRRVG